MTSPLTLGAARGHHQGVARHGGGGGDRGAVFALDPAIDFVAPMIRNAAACCDMGMPLADMLRAYLATADSPSGGRDLHAGSQAHHVLQPVSPVGVMVPVSAGIALAGESPARRAS